MTAHRKADEKPSKTDQAELDEAIEESFPASDPPSPSREPTRNEGEADKKKK